MIIGVIAVCIIIVVVGERINARDIKKFEQHREYVNSGQKERDDRAYAAAHPDEIVAYNRWEIDVDEHEPGYETESEPDREAKLHVQSAAAERNQSVQSRNRRANRHKQ